MPDKILVVDDNPITRKMLRLALAAEGFEVNAVGRASEVDAAVRQVRPDLILLDLVLPDATGFEVLAGLRGAPATERTPVLAVTGCSDVDRMFEAGFTDHLLKPIDPARLVDRVRLHLRAARGSTPGTRRVLVVDDDAIQLKVAQLNLRCLGFVVTTARGACEALASARQARPDVIVSDIVMPGIDGFQLCQSVRLDPGLATIPVVLTSSRHLERADRELGMRVGATTVVDRTADLAELVAAIREPAVIANSNRTLTRPDLSSSPHRELIAHLELQADRESQVSRAAQIWRSTVSILERTSELAEGSRELGPVLDGILAELLDASGFAAGLAYCHDGEHFELRSQLGFSPGDGELAEFFGALDVLSCALDGRAPVALDRGSVSRTAQDLLIRARIGSMLLLPIVRRNERIGLIVLGSLNATLPAECLELAKAVSGPIAQAIALTRMMAVRGDSDGKFRQLTESLSDGVLVADANQTIVYANAAAGRLLGHPPSELVAQPVSAHLSVRGGASEAPQLRLARPCREIVVDVATRPILADPSSTMYTLRDLTDHARRFAGSRLASHDPLTRLLNRHSFQEVLVPRLAEARRYGRGGSLLLLDLDRLKLINERFGNLAGDAVLRRVGQILVSTTRESDIRARLGGDDFAILLPHTSSQDAVRCARKLLANFAVAPVEIDGKSIAIEACIGIAVFPDHGTSRREIMDAADGALYRAKRGGHSRVCAHEIDDVVARVADDTAACGATHGLPASRVV